MNSIHSCHRLHKTSRSTRTLRTAAFAALFAGLAACSAASDSGEPVLDSTLDDPGMAAEKDHELAAAGDDAAPFIAIKADRAIAAERLARAVASALRDGSARRALYESITASPVKEGKLHLGTYLRNDDGRQLGAALNKGAGPEKEIAALLEATGQLEIYMPVKAHRAQWTGDEGVIVAVQLDEEAVPFGVDLDGRPVKLSRSAPPEVPTISIVPAESFDDDAQPLTGHITDTGLEPIAFDSTKPGLWINSVHIQSAGDYEGWLMGDPEFEMHLQNANTRGTAVCTHEGSLEPWAWNQNSDWYSDPFLLATSAQIPAGVDLVIAVYEDDDTRCKLVLDKDYVKLTGDALANAAGIYEGIIKKDFAAVGMAAYNLIVAAKSIISGNDDFVGLATGTGDIGTVPTTLTLMSQYMSPQGEISANLKYMCTGNTCGGAGDGCYCDAACVTYGDCCTNACSVCGTC
jgi:hypothetical protein